MKFFVKAEVQCEHCDERFPVELEAATECRGAYVVGGPSEYGGPKDWRFLGRYGGTGGWYCPKHWTVMRDRGREVEIPTFDGPEY